MNTAIKPITPEREQELVAKLVNCSFETLLALSREKTERGAAKLLFAE